MGSGAEERPSPVICSGSGAAILSHPTFDRTVHFGPVQTALADQISVHPAAPADRIAGQTARSPDRFDQIDLTVRSPDRFDQIDLTVRSPDRFDQIDQTVRLDSIGSACFRIAR